jgi:hypothetical protein
VQRNQETGQIIQRFRRPHDPLASVTTGLPDTSVFLLHPALDTFIRSQRTRKPFLQYQHIRVGDDLVWQPYFDKIMEVEKQLHKIDTHSFTESAHQVVKRIQSLLHSGQTPFARAEIENSEDWQNLYEHQQQNDCGDAILWLEELMKVL